MKAKSRRPSRPKRAQAGPKRSPRKYRWAWVAAVTALVLTAAIWGLQRALTGDRQPSISLPSPTPPAAAHIESFLASVPDRSFEAVADIKAEERALAEAVVADFPHRAEPLSLLASVYQSHGDIEQAEQLLKKSLALDPSQSEVYVRLGQMAQESDRLDQAIAYWQQGIKANPQAPNLRWHLADALVLQGRLEGAVELLETECTLTPTSARNYFLLGQVHLKQDSYEQARTCYEKTLELQPDYFNAHYGLGKVYTHLKQPDKAREHMQTFLKLKTVLEGSDDQRIVLDEAPVARARAAGLYRRAHSFYSSGERSTVGQRLLERAVALAPQDTRNWEKLGAFHFERRQFRTALAHFEKARQIDPNNPLFYLNIAALHNWLQRPGQAEATLTEALARFPQRALVHAELARFYLHRRSHAAAAKTQAERAVALEPSGANYFVLARACEATGDVAGAARAIERAVAREPDNAQFRDLHAYLQSRQ